MLWAVRVDVMKHIAGRRKCTHYNYLPLFLSPPSHTAYAFETVPLEWNAQFSQYVVWCVCVCVCVMASKYGHHAPYNYTSKEERSLTRKMV